ncbi:unnamed protein product, partial [Nippostrongylus brasiliensis]|uniref:Secreted protein n=1 Tax=Nippostrongylus brasiliensis TaxID=27835 RepID=A0A0N4XQL2_NIPBR
RWCCLSRKSGSNHTQATCSVSHASRRIRVLQQTEAEARSEWSSHSGFPKGRWKRGNSCDWRQRSRHFCFSRSCRFSSRSAWRLLWRSHCREFRNVFFCPCDGSDVREIHGTGERSTNAWCHPGISSAVASSPRRSRF